MARERGFFGKLLVFILTILALIGLVAMMLSVANPYINPKQFIWTSFFGLAFWEIFAFNVLVFIALLLLWSRKVWIAVIALAISIPGVYKCYSFGKPIADDTAIRVMSYNVHYFRPIDNKTDTEEFAYKIINKIREENVDVFCCQEFSPFKKGLSRNKCIDEFAQSAGLQHVYYNKKQNFGGNVIFSKYPLEKIADSSDLGKEIASGVMTVVNSGEKGRFLVANMHLVSNQITDGEINVLVHSSEHRNQLDTVGMSVARKLKYAFEVRSGEISDVLKSLATYDGPIIICGDFNDTPLSYTYKQMQRAGFVDTFTKVGRGIKPTYAGKLPLIRIDYIWGNYSVNPLKFKRICYNGSDHFPIVLDFKIEH